MTARIPCTSRKRSTRMLSFGWHIIGMLLMLLSLIHFSTASGFIKGMRSYFWTIGEGSILSSDLRPSFNSGHGVVTYAVSIDDVIVEDTNTVFKVWSQMTQSKYDEWASRYAEGNSTTVYYNRSGESSLGRWPTSYSYHSGIQGMTTLLAGLAFLLRGIRERKKANNASEDIGANAPNPQR